MSLKQLKDLNVDVEVLNKSALNRLAGGQEPDLPEEEGGPGAGDPSAGGPDSGGDGLPCFCGCVCIVG